MWRKTHGTQSTTTKTTVLPCRAYRDVIHARLEVVLVLRRANEHLGVTRIVREQNLKAFLLAWEKGRPEFLEILAGFMRPLKGVDDEAILQPNRVVRIALAAL
jgi:hypothetical protein